MQDSSANLTQHLQTSNLSDGLERSPRTSLDVVHSLSCDSSVTAEVLGSGSLEASMYNENTLKQLDMAVIGVDRPYYGQVRTSLLRHCGSPQRPTASQCNLCRAAFALASRWDVKQARDTSWPAVVEAATPRHPDRQSSAAATLQQSSIAAARNTPQT